MLRVQVDLLWGGWGEPKLIHELFIANITGGNPADYAVWAEDPRGNRRAGDPTPEPDVIVKGHVRQDGAMPLVVRAIEYLGDVGNLALTRRDGRNSDEMGG